MKDIQSEEPRYPVIINKVGIKGIQYPIRVLTKDSRHLDTIATIATSVSLMPGQRGTHMSRFIEIIEKYKHNVDGIAIDKMCKEISEKLVTEYSEIDIEFPYFVSKKAPVSNKQSLYFLIAGFLWTLDADVLTHRLKVRASVTSLCPCSKEISKYGAHNQRAYITLVLQPKEGVFIWFEDMLDIIEMCSSSPIYPLLKRKDEKFVTERAYENPMFMEDVVRSVFHKSSEFYYNKVSYIKVSAESEESIHQHLAFAEIERCLDDTNP